MGGCTTNSWEADNGTGEVGVIAGKKRVETNERAEDEGGGKVCHAAAMVEAEVHTVKMWEWM